MEASHCSHSLKRGRNFSDTNALTFSISSHPGRLASIALRHSHSRDERVPLPSVKPICLPADDMSVHGNE